MRYEVRMNGAAVASFDDPEQALALVQQAVRDGSAEAPEIIDTTTGRPLEPAASRDDREELRQKVGF
ncbi:MAG: hypothetical protein JOY70_05725 [Acidisphaera sp.]|nr:hypothetical protein [Acidisphaera sp.]MBV9811377.1 hypothetical protein [Acetobacteraceae bacterium]